MFSCWETSKEVIFNYHTGALDIQILYAKDLDVSELQG